MNDRDRQSQNLEAIYGVSIQSLQVHFPIVFLVLNEKCYHRFGGRKRYDSVKMGFTNLVSKAV